jgi:hypothetical protein
MSIADNVEDPSLMARPNSVPLYPKALTAGGILLNLVLNRTPDKKFQVARILKPGGPLEGDFEVLRGFDDQQAAREYATT